MIRDIPTVKGQCAWATMESASGGQVARHIEVQEK
jgi:hypothetical protein